MTTQEIFDYFPDLYAVLLKKYGGPTHRLREISISAAMPFCEHTEFNNGELSFWVALSAIPLDTIKISALRHNYPKAAHLLVMKTDRQADRQANEIIDVSNLRYQWIVEYSGSIGFVTKIHDDGDIPSVDVDTLEKVHYSYYNDRRSKKLYMSNIKRVATIEDIYHHTKKLYKGQQLYDKLYNIIKADSFNIVDGNIVGFDKNDKLHIIFDKHLLRTGDFVYKWNALNLNEPRVKEELLDMVNSKYPLGLYLWHERLEKLLSRKSIWESSTFISQEDFPILFTESEGFKETNLVFLNKKDPRFKQAYNALTPEQKRQCDQIYGTSDYPVTTKKDEKPKLDPISFRPTTTDGRTGPAFGISTSIGHGITVPKAYSYATLISELKEEYSPGESPKESDEIPILLKRKSKSLFNSVKIAQEVRIPNVKMSNKKSSKFN